MNRMIISQTKIAPVNKIYKAGKYRSPKNHVDWLRYKDFNFTSERIFYTEAFKNKVNKDYKVSYCSNKLTLIQSFERIDFETLRKIAELTGEASKFNKILLGKNNNLYPALRSTASINPLSYRKGYILDHAKTKYNGAESHKEPTDMIIIDL